MDRAILELLGKNHKLSQDDDAVFQVRCYAEENDKNTNTVRRGCLHRECRIMGLTKVEKHVYRMVHEY